MKPPSRTALKTLCETLVPGGRVVRVGALKGGVSSVVHAVRLEAADRSRRDVVVRRFGEYWVQNDPAVGMREFKLLEQLSQTTLPVPKPLFLDADGSIFGAPTVVMTRLPGRAVMIPRDVELFLRRMARTLAELHAVPTHALTFLIRQRDRGDRFVKGERRLTDPLFQEVMAEVRAEWPRVRDSLPSQLVHADYWPGNLLWRRDHLVGVVDWENPRLGDPTEDLATLRREAWLLFGPAAADRLVDYYVEAGGQVGELRFWSLWVAPDALEEMPDWLPGYHELGRTDLTLEQANASMQAFARDALGRA